MKQSFCSNLHRKHRGRVRGFLTAVLHLAVLSIPLARAQQPTATMIEDLPVDQAVALLKVAVAAGDEHIIFGALLYKNHPGIIHDALDAVAQQHTKNAMPRLIELYAWLNTADGGPVWTGTEMPPYDIKEHRDGATMKLSDEVVAIVDAITAKTVKPPKDHSYAEGQSYLNDVKAWWHANK